MTAHDRDDIPSWFKRPIIRPSTDFERDAVVHAQRVLRCAETGEMDEPTISHLRGLQSLFGLPTTGILDTETAKQIERIRNQYSV